MIARRLVTSLLLGAALVACTAEPETPSPTSPPIGDPATAPTGRDRSGGTLRVALATDPGSIDPRFLADEEGELVADALFDSLTDLDAQLRPTPGAAVAWEPNDDLTVWTFTLREGARFHDGTPVTAADFVRSFRRIADGTADPRSFVSYLLAPVVGYEAAQTDGVPLSGVEAVDDSTLVVRLSRPMSEFPAVVANPALAPVPADIDDATFAETPVGNGPFAMAGPWEHDRFIRVAKVEDHWRSALLDEVVFQIYPDDESGDAQWDDLEAGQLHVGNVTPEHRDEAIAVFGRSEDGYRGPGVLDGTTTTIYYYGFNVTDTALDDRRVRQALSLVIDRGRIADELLRGTRLAADAIVPAPVPGAQPGSCGHCVLDPARARKLLEAAGGPGLFTEPLRLVHNEGETHRRIAEIVAAGIREHLGIEVETSEAGLRAFIGELRSGEADVFRLGWTADHPSMGAYLDPLFHGANTGEDNLTFYAVDEVDALLDEARATAAEGARLALYRRAETQILHDAPVAPVLFYRLSKVVARDVHDLRIDALGAMDLSNVWLDEG